MESLIAALLGGSALGWVAIPHCLGMCGPLHVSVCALNRKNSLRSLSFFNIGRIIGYTFAGIIFGAFGEFINLGPSRYCCELSSYPIRGAMLSLLFPGITIFLLGIYSVKKKNLKITKLNWLTKMMQGGMLKLTGGGICTTLIPCGMLYAAFALAIGTGSWIGGGVFMLSFAITQTFFMQLGVSIGRLFGNKWSNRVNNLFPYLCIFLGMIYIFLFFNKIQPI
jgi:sulfite exporter TauE/SafE